MTKHNLVTANVWTALSSIKLLNDYKILETNLLPSGLCSYLMSIIKNRGKESYWFETVLEKQWIG